MFYLFMAEGTEEVEAIATLDVLRRAEIDVKTVGIGSKIINGSHNVPIVCDITENDIEINSLLEGIILPGGMPGTINLEKSTNVQNCIEFCAENNLFICAICAAPSVLGHAGVLRGEKALCFPGFEKELVGASIADGFVCTSGKIITGKGMGCAVLFGLEIVKGVKGKTFADALKATLQCAI